MSLEIKNLRISFRRGSSLFEAVHGVSFSLGDGRALGIVGESGCGKTLSAMSVMRLLPSTAVITEGEIVYNGLDILSLSEKEMRMIRGNKIALIPQDPLTSLNPLYTIGDQLMEVILLHQEVTKKDAKEIALESLNMVKIPDASKRFDDYPYQFSGGMCQRVIIAMALASEPDLIIADEPTTALDVTVQAQIMELFSEIRQKRKTSLILITHDLGLISENVDDVAVMYAGAVVEYASVKELFLNPSHPYTKGLLGSLPRGSKERLKIIEGQPPQVGQIISGCRFHPRCEFVMDRCNKKYPERYFLSDNHSVNCFLYE